MSRKGAVKKSTTLLGSMGAFIKIVPKNNCQTDGFLHVLGTYE